MRALLSKMVELFPAPHERPPVEAQKWGSAERLMLKAEDGGPFVGQVFKTMSEPHVGDVTYFRVYCGMVRNGQDVYNAPRAAVEKLNHLCVSIGKDRFEIAELHAGDIGVGGQRPRPHPHHPPPPPGGPHLVPQKPLPPAPTTRRCASSGCGARR